MGQVPLIVGWRHATEHFEIFGEVGLVMEVQVMGQSSEIGDGVVDTAARFVNSEDSDKGLIGYADPLLTQTVDMPSAVRGTIGQGIQAEYTVHGRSMGKNLAQERVFNDGAETPRQRRIDGTEKGRV